MKHLIGLILFAVGLFGQNRSTPLVILPSADDAATGELRLREKRVNGNSYAGFKAPNALGANIVWTVPSADGTAGQALVTNGAGVLSFGAVGTGTVTSSGTPTIHQLPIWTTATDLKGITLAANAILAGVNAADPAGKSLADLSPTEYAVGGGIAQAQTVALAPAATALAAGLTVRWLPIAANTGAGPTLAVNGLIATTVTKCGTAALVANDLTTTAVAIATYDGTRYQLLNPQAVGCGGGSGNVTGPAAGAGGEFTTVDAAGTTLSRSALTGVLKGASGVPSVVTGTGSNCVHVDGTSAACGGGASGDLSDFAASVATNTLTMAAGRARIGNYAPNAIGTGGVTFTGGTGNVRVFIDASNNLVCHVQTGVTYSAPTGALACSSVTTPAYPVNGIPIANVTVTAGVPVITSDDRAFFSARGVSAATGISIADAGGVASVGIDTASVPLLGQANAWTAGNDFTAATNFYIRRGAGAPAAAECDVAAEVGQLYARQDAAAAGASLYVCSNTGAATYAWEIAGAGGSSAPTGAQYLTLALDATLSAERVLTPGVGLQGTDAGANGAYTLALNPFDRSIYQWVEEFNSALTTLGSIGSLGWQLFHNNGSTVLTAANSEANHPGILNVGTGATSGNDGNLLLRNPAGSGNGMRMDNITNWEVQFIVRPTQVLTVGHYLGLGNYYVAYGADRIVAKFDTGDADATWKFQTCAASVCTVSASTIAPSAAGWYRIRIRSTTAGTILFSVNGESEVSISTNVPSALLTPALSVITRTTAASSIDLDWAAGSMTVTR